jgi:hypothetical protein
MIDFDHLEVYLDECTEEECEVANIKVDDVRKLITRLLQAEKDAARYGWLRDVACYSEWHVVGSADPSVWDVIVDEYIDEAMQCK